MTSKGPISTTSCTAGESDSSRNLPAVARIPYEIFKEIILDAYIYTPEMRDKEEYQSFNKQLVFPPIVASHVCQWWRRALLSDPNMWTCFPIPQIKPCGVLELLHRSNMTSSLLYIFLALGNHSELRDDGTTTMFNVLFRQIHRMKLLHLHVKSVDLSADHDEKQIQHVLLHLRKPAPNLQTFRLSHTDSRYPLLLPPLFLHKLFEGQASTLKHLHIPFVYNSGQPARTLFCNLSELHLIIPSNSAFCFNYLLDLLQSTPGLELFRLLMDWRSRYTQIRDPESFLGRKVDLPHLQRFVLEVDRVVGLAQIFLKHVTFPRYTKWRIVSEDLCESSLSQTSHWQDLLRDVRFTSLHVHFTSTDRVVLSLKEHGRQDLLNDSDDHELVYTFAISQELLSWGGPLTVHTIVSSCSITHLFLKFESGVQPEVHAQLLDLVPNVVSITIEENIQIQFHDFFMEPWLDCMYALQLRHVDWDDTEFNSSDKTYLQTAFPCPSLCEISIDLGRPLKKRDVYRIRKCFRERREYLFPLKVLVRCSRMEEGLDRMLQMGRDDIIHVSCSE